MLRTALLLAAATLLTACSGGTEAAAPTIDYGADPVLLRVGEAATVPGASTSGANFRIDPALPAGLTIDPSTGAIAGTPSAVTSNATYTVRGTLGSASVEAQLSLAVGRALPDEVASLEAGFTVERVAQLSQPPAKMAIAPDGRVFVTELLTGSIRVVDADGDLRPTPFATLSVVNGAHRGLLGVALSPAFATDSLVFVMACVPAGGGKPARSVVYRYVDTNSVGTSETVLLDDLPVAAINNGGALCFDPTGMLLVTVGDTEVPTLSQSDSSLAGKVLRVRPSDGGIPTDNPDPSSLVYCKGLRNTFALTVHPTLQTILAADNGPATDDRLLLLQPGRNFSWGASAGASFGALEGVQLRLWSDVVVPTGLAYRDATDGLDWPGDYDRSLYLALYDEEVIERFSMSGAFATDIDAERVFLRFVVNGQANKPLDVQRGPAGRLWVLTFSGVYRVDRIR